VIKANYTGVWPISRTHPKQLKRNVGETITLAINQDRPIALSYRLNHIFLFIFNHISSLIFKDAPEKIGQTHRFR